MTGAGFFHAKASLVAGLVGAWLLGGCAAPGAGAGSGLSAGGAGSRPTVSISSARFCDQGKVHDAQAQDRMLRFAAVIRDTLADSGEAVALIARSGLDLDRFNIRFSHAGIALRDSDVTPWSVRQLYYACDAGKPMLFDQGIAGFVFNSDSPLSGHVSIVFLPSMPAEALEDAAQDRDLALRLLAAQYSANAYPFSTRYQNCNQWVIEMIATAWGRLADGEDLRARAQAWLRQAGYDPAPVMLDSHLLRFGAQFVPLVYMDDHPPDEQIGLSLTLSLPVSIETFVREQQPRARRVEICHDSEKIVVRQGWEPLGRDCLPAPGDRVIPLLS